MQKEPLIGQIVIPFGRIPLISQSWTFIAGYPPKLAKIGQNYQDTNHRFSQNIPLFTAILARFGLIFLAKRHTPFAPKMPQNAPLLSGPAGCANWTQMGPLSRYFVYDMVTIEHLQSAPPMGYNQGPHSSWPGSTNTRLHTGGKYVLYFLKYYGKP